MGREFKIRKIVVESEVSFAAILNVYIDDVIYILDDDSEWKLEYIKVYYRKSPKRNTIFLCTYDKKSFGVVTDSLKDTVSINDEKNIEGFREWINKRCKQFMFESAFK